MMITMGWPQIFMIAWFALALGVKLSKHGEPMKGNHSFGYALIAVAIEGTVLWFGGFFG